MTTSGEVSIIVIGWVAVTDLKMESILTPTFPLYLYLHPQKFQEDNIYLYTSYQLPVRQRTMDTLQYSGASMSQQDIGPPFAKDPVQSLFPREYKYQEVLSITQQPGISFHQYPTLTPTNALRGFPPQTPFQMNPASTRNRH